MDKNMRIHYLQHVSFEGPGCIANWTKRLGYDLTLTRLYMNEKFPLLSDIDCLIVLGGPMGIYDDKLYPWLVSEKEYIKAAVDQGKVVIGICLGAQLLAHVLGAKVVKGEHKEIGWYPVNKTEEGFHSELLKQMPDELPVFHWHGDQFMVPQGAKHLAKSEACPTQMFSFNDRAIGIQFHFEANESSVKELLRHGKDELTGGRFIQSPSQIELEINNCVAANEMMYSILDGLLVNKK